MGRSSAPWAGSPPTGRRAPCRRQPLPQRATAVPGEGSRPVKPRETPRSRWSRSLAAAPASRRLTSASACSGGWCGSDGRSAPGPTLRWRWPVALLAAALALALGAARADAQPGPAYAATPPTYGALYQDGPNDRWLLGGTWLQRADPSNTGTSAGWYRNVASTSGWSSVSVPNSYNAGNLSSASMNGSVEWYRKDF